MISVPNSSKQAFQHRIYSDLEYRLRDTPWNSGASEAQGVLCGLACTGITADTIRTRASIFRLQDSEHVDIIEGLFGLVCRDLDDEEFAFELMLPSENVSQTDLAEAISDWCQGFLQGIFYQDTDLLETASPTVEEALRDIIQIGHIEIDTESADQNERDLSEIVEFLRVATQLIYDENLIENKSGNPIPKSINPTSLN